MRSIRNNLAFILLGIFALVLVFFMVRLQGLILSTQSSTAQLDTAIPTTNTTAPVQQQPAVLVVPTATAVEVVGEADSTDPANATESDADETNGALQQAAPTPAPGYQIYGSMVIGAIHIGAINDRGFNQANDEGLRRMIEQIPDARLISAENIPETEAVVPVIDDMVARGAQMIFTQSFGYLPYALAATERYPNVIFMNAGGFERNERVGTYLANHVEAMYLTGMAAGAATKSNQLGFISAFPMPSSLASVNAFHLGALAVNPNVETRIVNNGSWLDPVKEKQATEALATVGVDVVAMIVDSPIAIVETARERNMYVIGFHSGSLQELAPDQWLTGVEHTWGNFFTQVVEQVRAGQWQSSHVRGGIESDMFQLAPFGPAINEEMQARILAAQRDIIGGRLKIFAGPIVDNLGIERVPAGSVGEVTLLDNTDWLIEGVSDFEATSVAIAPVPTASAAAESTGKERDGSEATAMTADGANEDPVVDTSLSLNPSTITADLLLGVTSQRPECGFFTETIAAVIRTEFIQTVEIINFPSVEEMYQGIAGRQDQQRVDLTLCFGDPADRPFLREHFGFVKHIGSVFWEGADYRLQILGNTSYAAAIERDQTCLYRFLKNIHFEGTEMLSQRPEDWITAQPDTIRKWSDCTLSP